MMAPTYVQTTFSWEEWPTQCSKFPSQIKPQAQVWILPRIVDSLWKKWSRDASRVFSPAEKWNTSTRNVQVGDFVIVADPNAVRGEWQTGRVVEVFPGEDGRVRNIKVKTATGNYLRPITKIRVIYPVEGFDKEKWMENINSPLRGRGGGRYFAQTERELGLDVQFKVHFGSIAKEKKK